jgi:hypothetical protein
VFAANGAAPRTVSQESNDGLYATLAPIDPADDLNEFLAREQVREHYAKERRTMTASATRFVEGARSVSFRRKNNSSYGPKNTVYSPLSENAQDCTSKHTQPEKCVFETSRAYF